MESPFELMSWYVIPSIRNNIVKQLKKLGLKQDKIARIMQVTPSAVSQYISNKRGTEVKFNKEFEDLILQSAVEILKDETRAFDELNKLSLFYQKNHMLCKLCKEKNNIEFCEVDCK